MGAREAPGRDEYGRSFYRAPGLGFIPWATVIGGAVDLARSFIGGSDATSCPGQYSGAQLGNLLIQLTPAEMNALYTAFNKVNAGSVQPYFKGVDLDWMAFALAGGGDCKVTTTNGRALVSQVQALFQKYPSALAAGDMLHSMPYPSTATNHPPVLIAGPGTLPTSGSTDTTPVYDPGPALPTSSVPDPGPSLWDQIKDYAGEAARAAAAAAARSAATSVSNVPAVREQLDVYAQQQRSDFMSRNMPLIIGAGVLLGALVLMPARAPARR